jgi:hypothetical protein
MHFTLYRSLLPSERVKPGVSLLLMTFIEVYQLVVSYCFFALTIHHQIVRVVGLQQNGVRVSTHDMQSFETLIGGYEVSYEAPLWWRSM